MSHASDDILAELWTAEKADRLRMYKAGDEFTVGEEAYSARAGRRVITRRRMRVVEILEERDGCLRVENLANGRKTKIQIARIAGMIAVAALPDPT